MSKNKIFFIRHARTEENIKGVIQGASIEGVIPAADLSLLDRWADSLHKVVDSPGLIISSDQFRSLETAEMLQNRFKLPLLRNHYLRQRSWGSNEGKLVDRLNSSFTTDPYTGEAGKELPPDAESLNSVKNRTRKFVEYLKENLLNKNPIVISHNEIISYILNEILGRDLFFHDTLPTEGHIIGLDEMGRVCEINLHAISPAYSTEKNILVYVRQDAERFCEKSSVGIRILTNRGYKITRDLSAANNAQAIIIGDDLFNKKDVDSKPNLKIIARLGSGTDAVDRHALAERGIILTNTPVYDRSVAEFTLSLILYFIKGIPSASLDVRNKNWRPQRFYWSDHTPPTIGIVGLGKVGRTLCRLLKSLDVFIIAWSRDVKSGKKFCDSMGIYFCESLNYLLSESDIVSLHIALNRETRNLLGSSEFEIIGKGKRPYLINTSRGGIIDDNALLYALESGYIRGAALDVWNKEGENSEDEDEVIRVLRTHPLVIPTPHIAGGGYLVGLMVSCLTAYNIDWVLRGLSHLASVVSTEKG